MSCLSALGSQIFAFISVPHEVLSLQHKVFQEYVKVALGPDFSHTFPSFILITAVCIALWKNLRFKWLPILNFAPFRAALEVILSWVILNGVLWYWLLLQKILYCFVWTHWNKDFGIQENYFPWWRKVWSSFYPPSSAPPVFSASLISWLLSMMIALGALWCAMYTDKARSSFSRISVNIKQSMKALKECNVCSDIKSSRAPETASEITVDLEETDKSELESICEECKSDTCSYVENCNQKTVNPKREISPISYGTNWTPRPEFTTKPLRGMSCRTVAGVTECKESENNCLPRNVRNRRGCHTVIPSSSSEKSMDC